ncbi:uncharacterized protein LOC110100230 [Dendrobium catenatum]|uniref:Uncharacterized protein n=1 Tax=Dendrobium catenatum TaxID=906689 RepID=A0A2I0WRE8_9ASPA|nr:uncharacterized protein LOC110100230 [Dendrobium catenatum]PKU78235.1 hypothetical protein MA16_Dca022011 [Dendrobium catenatum]
MSPLLLLPLILFAAAGAIANISDDTSSVYDALQSYNFPIGLLPKGAVGYDLDNSTGDFLVYFNGTCSFSLEGSYQLGYQSSISGRISTNRLSNLKGVRVKVVFFWINIVEVVRNGDELEFSVGIASANFAINNFVISPQCGCGLNCKSLGNRSKEGYLVILKSAV